MKLLGPDDPPAWSYGKDLEAMTFRTGWYPPDPDQDYGAFDRVNITAAWHSGWLHVAGRHRPLLRSDPTTVSLFSFQPAPAGYPDPGGWGRTVSRVIDLEAVTAHRPALVEWFDPHLGRPVLLLLWARPVDGAVPRLMVAAKRGG